MNKAYIYTSICITRITCMFSVAEADTADIGGLVFYHTGNENDYAQVDGATVTLYKRNTSNGWDTFGSSTTTDEDGYYHFDDVEIGSGINGLCPNSNWFRVKINASATGVLPSWWSYDDVLHHYTKNIPQPSGFPDPGWIRIDVNFCTSDYDTPPERSFKLWGVQGHYCFEDGEGGYTSTSMNNGYATCPVGEHETDVEGCMPGHWNNNNQSDDWSDEGEPLNGQPDYAYYEFWDTPPPDPPILKVAEGYYYWDMDWPEWALHEETEGDDVIINIDFVDTNFPPE